MSKTADPGKGVSPVPLPSQPAETSSPTSRALRRYLYFTAACTGAAIMIVEILGAKMLSPFMGASHFVWTAQIAVTLVALASGYYVGGKVADVSQNLSWLYYSILGAALYLAVTVLSCRPVAFWCLGFNLAVGSLLTSVILFFLPLALLAMTGPFLIRVITSSISGLGGNVGRLTGIGTVGSLLGTLLIGYLLVPLLPNSVSMYLTAIALSLLSVGYFAVFQRASVAIVLGAIVPLAFSGFGVRAILKPGYESMKELTRVNSNFGTLQVLQRVQDGCLFLLDDNLIQNTYDPKLQKSVSHFTYLLSGLAKAYHTNVQEVLCLGLGAGIVPMEFARGGARVDVVEINPKVLPVVTQFFEVDPGKINVVIDDGRHFLNQTTRQYDAVILDVFLGDSSPSHLLTREAFGSIRRVLRPEGILVINSFGKLEEDRDFFAASICRTLQAVFPSVRMHTSGRGEMFYAASTKPSLSFVRRPDVEAVHPQVRRYAEMAYYGLVEAAADRGRVLTDDYNPAEFYDAPNREEYRRSMAESVRSM